MTFNVEIIPFLHLFSVSKLHSTPQYHLKGTHARDFIVRFWHFCWHHSVIDKAEAQNFKNFVKISVWPLYIIRFSRIPLYRRKLTVSLRVSGENAAFHSAYLPKTHSYPSLNALYTAKSAQFYSAFLPTPISLTPRFRWKREVWLRLFAQNTQNDPKTHSYEDSTRFNSAFLATTLSHASRFRRKRGVIENFEYLCEF